MTTPSPSPNCLKSTFCSQVYEWTDNVWLSDTADWVLTRPVWIAAVIAGATLVRLVLHRIIDRFVRRRGGDAGRGFLRPARQRPEEPVDPLQPERRQQRAAAVGSVLKIAISGMIYAIVTLWSLDRLGFNLAPLLTSAGIIGLALGFGAQQLVRDLIAGVCMLLEDQYGVGDVVDVGPFSGVVEAVGWRITTVRDAAGVIWHIRNGEITRVGNKSQGWAMAVVDVPIGFASVEQATRVLEEAAAALARDPAFKSEFIEPPAVVGVEALTVDGAVLRATAKTTVDAHVSVVRELRRRLAEALDDAGLEVRGAARTNGDPVTEPGGAT
ncbi:mechanosensitive ion channel protein MscS [Pilimelia terevasa]|uniref:Mechanosensitive ion channel protein MscS n=1 Tax=Pilimelia terevasa TaxID=53372 RepID=A0A8J3BVJ5_9ACTN|nr:mechanosensitive ion channel family protein [Pilimelia terevasa]GGK38273.1 mechanosensitive ion channel protein MscS [Pilimelia terevasa]